MKVAFLSTVHGHAWPGSEFLWADTAEALLSRGAKVYAHISSHCQDSQEVSKLVTNGLNVGFYSIRESLPKRLWQKLYSPARLRLVRQFKPSCLVVSCGSAFDPVYQPSLAWFLRETELPFILICHFNAETFGIEQHQRLTMRELYSKSAAQIFVSQDNRRITERQLAMVLPNALVIRPPFPLVLDSPLEWPRADPGLWKMACVARLDTRWKGQDVLFEVLAGEDWRDRNWILNLYGTGAEEGYLRELAHHYSISDRVIFRGFVADRAEIWRDNHIQVCPTRGEGGPMVLTEGMMAGRLAVISDCGNVRDYVIDGHNGYIASFSCPSEFGYAMERAWQDRMQWETMGIKAHHWISTQRGEQPHLSLLRVIDEFVSPG